MKIVNTSTLIKMIESAANNLNNNKQHIDNLNVFPVPDGDTGSNMSSTFNAINEEAQRFSSTGNIRQLIKKCSKASLMGARGNSGVILSQILKGFANVEINEKPFTIKDVLEGFKRAKKTAYESVIKPVEGTILTVIKDTSINLNKIVKKDITIIELFEHIVKISNKSLDNTPNLLAILKEVGVVDSGGKGLVVIFEGMLSALKGKIIKPISDDQDTASSSFLMKKEIFNGEFGYCTEFIIKIKIKNSYEKKTIKNLAIRTFHKSTFLQSLKKMGSSSEVIAQDDDILKVHCHVPNAVKVLTLAQKFGDFVKVKIDNMNEQTAANVVNPGTMNDSDKITEGITNNSDIAVISCNNGQGIIEEIKSYGVGFIIEGGQTMNPSAGDFVSAIKTLNANKIIILPNNSNVILAAKQAAKTTKKKRVVVLPTKTQVQGLVAMIQYNHEETMADNISEMKEAISEVKSIAITQAIRTTKIDKVRIKEGDYMGILDGKIMLTDKSKIKATIKIIKKNIDEMSEIVTIYVGMDGDSGDGKQIAEIIESECDIETILKDGGQQSYDFLVSIE